MKGASDGAEIRAPSIKGLLRWWFRTLGGDFEWEKRLFGSQDNRSSFVIRVKGSPSIIGVGRQEFSNEQAYLGYGPIGYNKRTKNFVNSRPFLTGKFSLEIAFSRLSDKDLKALLLSLWSLSVFGGMGSRSRRGWGSVSIEPPDEGTPSIVRELGLSWKFKSREDLQKSIAEFEEKRREIFGELPSQNPEYTRFSHRSRFCIGGEFDSWESAMNDVGGKLISFRNRRYSEDVKRFMKDVESGNVENPYSPTGSNIPYGTAVPKAIFGLPNNYLFRLKKKDLREKDDRKQKIFIVNVIGEYRDEKKRRVEVSRRASPLLISIDKIGDKHTKYIWLITYLPARFLPDNGNLLMTVPKKQLPQNWKGAPPRAYTGLPSYKLLEEFLRFSCEHPVYLNRR